MKSFKLVAAESDRAGPRLDRFIAARLPELSRSQLKERLASLLVNGRPAKLSRRIKPGDVIELVCGDPPRTELEPEALDLTVIHEDARTIVVDKPAGMVVHPGSGVRHGTLVQGLLHRVASLAERFGGEDPRPGIVHRLDKDTSGVIIAAKDPVSLRMLADQFKARSVAKTYLAVTRGCPPKRRGAVHGFLRRDPANRQRFRLDQAGGKASLTDYRVLRRWADYSLVLLKPRTGRTHQLRVHLKALGCPIAGDALYGGRAAAARPESRLMLHAWLLELTLPDGRSARFRAPVPPAIKDFLRDLGADRRCGPIPP